MISETIFGRGGYAPIFTDHQIFLLQNLVQESKTYSLNRGDDKLLLGFKEIAIVLDFRVLYKEDTVWNTFVKIVANNGIIGWISKDHLTSILKSQINETKSR